MKKKPFTDQEREELNNNPNVKSVGKVSVFYTEEFKEKAVFEHSRGKSVKQIFIEAGIDLEAVGHDRPKDCLGEGAEKC